MQNAMYCMTWRLEMGGRDSQDPHSRQGDGLYRLVIIVCAHPLVQWRRAGLGCR